MSIPLLTCPKCGAVLSPVVDAGGRVMASELRLYSSPDSLFDDQKAADDDFEVWADRMGSAYHTWPKHELIRMARFASRGVAIPSKKEESE